MEADFVRNYKFKLRQAFWGPIDLECPETGSLDVSVTQDNFNIEFLVSDAVKKRNVHRRRAVKRRWTLPKRLRKMKMNFDPYYLTQILYTNHETGTEYPTAIMLRLNERGFKHIKSTARQLFHKWQTTLESRSHPPQAFSDTILLVIDPEKFVSAETRQEARNLAWRDQSREVMDDIGLQLRNFTVYGWGDVPNIEAGDNVCEHLSGREFRRIFEEFGLQIDGDRFSYDPQASSSRNLTLKADEVPSEDSTDGEEDDDCSGNSEWGEIEMIETEVKRQIKRKREDENGLREDSESPPCSPTLKRRRNEELA